MVKRVVCSAEEWNQAMHGTFQRHILQSTAWATFKACTDWHAHYVLWYSDHNQLIGGVSLLEKMNRIPMIGLSLKILYAPRGPVIDWQNFQQAKEVLQDLAAYGKELHAVYLKIDPEVFFELDQEKYTTPSLGTEIHDLLKNLGWRDDATQIQFKNTFWLDIRADEEALLAAMKQKTRYNVRLAGKKGVTVRIAKLEDFHLLYRMYAETAQRDGFIIRSEDYYVDLWQQFYQQEIAHGLIAEVDGEAVAGLILFLFEQRAWYFYGMSTEKHRNLMPTYLLQWEAIRLAKQFGCTLYDLWGAPDELDENDGMYGVYRFKLGLGADFVRSIGAWDYVFKPFWYGILAVVLPFVLSLMRHIRRGKINKELLFS